MVNKDCECDDCVKAPCGVCGKECVAEYEGYTFIDKTASLPYSKVYYKAKILPNGERVSEYYKRCIECIVKEKNKE